MKKPNKTFCRWLAGFFDGEGCVSSRTPKNNHYPTITTHIGQKKPAVLYHIKRIVGIGRVRKTNQGVYRFEVWGKENTTFFIKLILPFSLVKRKQLELALQLFSLIGPPNTRVTKENKKKRIVLAKKIKALKH